MVLLMPVIELASGNLLEAPAEALVNSVNTVGVMGKGIALQFKRAYPEMFKAYAAACKAGELEVGSMHVFETGLIHPRFIINFPTKKHWRQPSRAEYIRSGLAALRREVEERSVTSIAIPPIGCGAGGLSWSVVRPMIEKAFADMDDVRVFLFAPGHTPAAKDMPNRTSRPNMTPGRAAVLSLAGAYLEAGLEDHLTTLEFQKLAYFMQLAGEDLRLTYKPHHYGPYADALRKVLEVMEGHFISGLGDDASKPDAEIELLPGALEEARAALGASARTREHVGRVLELLHGFEDAYGLELLATTSWVAGETAGEAVRAVTAWSDRKARLFSESHVRAAWSRLHEHDWAVRRQARAVAN